jgi:Protein of unknown function DUF2617
MDDLFGLAIMALPILRPSVEEMVFQLYGRPLHPELFDILAARRLRVGEAMLNLWLTRTGHAISWQNRRSHLTEVVAADQPLPECGRLLTHKLRGERCDMLGNLTEVNYQVSFQLEMLAPEQFLSVHQEILADGGKHGLLHTFAPNHRWALTPVGLINVESRDGCLFFSTFHTFPDDRAVVKTQSLIERR